MIEFILVSLPVYIIHTANLICKQTLTKILFGICFQNQAVIKHFEKTSKTRKQPCSTQPAILSISENYAATF